MFIPCTSSDKSSLVRSHSVSSCGPYIYVLPPHPLGTFYGLRELMSQADTMKTIGFTTGTVGKRVVVQGFGNGAYNPEPRTHRSLPAG